jgi:hypothetical protein
MPLKFAIAREAQGADDADNGGRVGLEALA